MKREDVKAKIQGITDEQLDWLMNENGADIAREKNTAERIRGELNTANQTIQSLQEAAKKFDGVDVDGLRNQIKDLQGKYDADIAAVRKDSAIELALSSCHAKNSKAARALLDMDAIKLDGDKLQGLDEQLENIRKDNPWMFDEAAGNPGGTGIQVNTGTEHGAGGNAGTDGVEAAFAALNPNIKL